MNASAAIADRPSSLSDEARKRMVAVPGEPMFVADWERALFIHFEADVDVLQSCVPFSLDLHEGRAFVSLVAFTMRGMRPRLGGALTAWMLRPIATHPFLNVRTYVRHRGEPGIFFLAEWLSNRLSVLLGPRLFGLPYRCGSLDYSHIHERGEIAGIVTDANQPGCLSYGAKLARGVTPGECAAGSLDEFLLERYTAFTARGRRRRFFRIWHTPWPQVPALAGIEQRNLLELTGPWARGARCIGAHYSPGVRGVWMGRPHRLYENGN